MKKTPRLPFDKNSIQLGRFVAQWFKQELQKLQAVNWLFKLFDTLCYRIQSIPKMYHFLSIAFFYNNSLVSHYEKCLLHYLIRGFDIMIRDLNKWHWWCRVSPYKCKSWAGYSKICQPTQISLYASLSFIICGRNTTGLHCCQLDWAAFIFFFFFFGSF